jgi:hypothetical protein
MEERLEDWQWRSHTGTVVRSSDKTGKKPVRVTEGVRQHNTCVAVSKHFDGECLIQPTKPRRAHSFMGVVSLARMTARAGLARCTQRSAGGWTAQPVTGFPVQPLMAQQVASLRTQAHEVREKLSNPAAVSFAKVRLNGHRS